MRPSTIVAITASAISDVELAEGTGWMGINGVHEARMFSISRVVMYEGMARSTADQGHFGAGWCGVYGMLIVRYDTSTSSTYNTL